MPKFVMRHKDGKVSEQSYTALMVIAGSETHKLALHRPSKLQSWVVSDPKSGCKVCTVQGNYKGVPCSSATYPATAAKELALASVEALIARIGSAKFNAVLANPKPF